jgi:hypothetical protein
MDSNERDEYPGKTEQREMKAAVIHLQIFPENTTRWL